MNIDHITAVVKKHNGSRGKLISILEDIQGKYGYLPEDALRIVSILLKKL